MSSRYPPRRIEPLMVHTNGKNGSQPGRSGKGVLRVFGDNRLAVESDLLAVFLDERGVWSVEEYGIVRQWSLISGRVVQRQCLGEAEPLWAFSRDGKFLAAAGQQLTLFEPATGEELACTQPDRWVTSLAWSSDGRWLATGHENGTIELWSVPGLTHCRTLVQDRQAVSAVAFSSDGEYLAAADESRQLVIWRRFDGARLKTFLVPGGRIPALAWHPQAPLLCSAGWDTHAHVWSLQQPEPIALFNAHAECVTALTFAPDGQLLATGDNAGVVRLWDFDRRQLLHEMSAGWGEIVGLAFDPAGRQLLSASEDRRLIVWDVATGQPCLGCGGGAALMVRLAASSRYLALVTGRQVHVFDWQQGRKCFALDHPHGAGVATFHKSGEFLLTADGVGSIHIWRVSDGGWHNAWQEHHTAIRELSWHENGDVLASAGGSDGYVYLWTWEQPQPTLLLPEAAGGLSAETVAFVPGYHALLVGGVNWLAESGNEGGLFWWDCDRWQRRIVMRQGVTRLAVRGDGRRAVVADLSGTAWLLELPSGKILAELAGHSEPVFALAFHPRTGEILTASEDHLLTLWSPEGRWMRATDLEVAVHDACFSSDGRFVFTANGDQTCYQLDAAQLGFGRSSQA